MLALEDGARLRSTTHCWTSRLSRVGRSVALPHNMEMNLPKTSKRRIWVHLAVSTWVPRAGRPYYLDAPAVCYQ
jgi:hypothetical protein